mgnify:CR=1 FL=1
MVNEANVAALHTAIRDRAIVGTFLPAVFVLEPTNRCNVKCVMCPNKRFKGGELGDVSLDAWQARITSIAPVAELVMMYFMGESTLHPVFADLMAAARRGLRGRLVLSTNAMELTQTAAQAMIDNLDVIIVCIDRWNAGAYEAIRRGGVFNDVVSAVEMLLRLRGQSSTPEIVVKTLDLTLSSEPRSQLEREERAFDEFWRARGAVPLSGWLNTWAGQFLSLAKLATRGTPYSSSKRGPCADLWFKMVINWRGEVVMCCHDWRSQTVIGSLPESDLHELWHSEILQRMRSEHSAGNFAQSRLCGGCREWGEADELDAYLRLDESDMFRVF